MTTNNNYETRDQYYARRDALAFKLARGHAFTESAATANVCAVCGAHETYHEATDNATGA